MNAEALALEEPAERSAGAHHIARRMVAATVLTFAVLIMLAGRSRADVLDPAQAAEGAVDAVGQVVETATDQAAETVGAAVDAASETVQPLVDTATDVVETVSETLDPVADGLGPVRKATETLLPGARGLVPGDAPDPLPQPPIEGATPPTPRFPPATHAGSRGAGAGSILDRSGIAPSRSSMGSSISQPVTDAVPALPSGASRGHAGASIPFGPFGRAVPTGPLTLLVLSAALAASLNLRPPPIRSLLASRVDAPNGAALALSVERPG